MPLPLPDPPDHAALLFAIARLALPMTEAPARPLIVLPDHMQTPAEASAWERISPDSAPEGGGFDRIIALDLWSRAVDPVAMLARLRAALARDGCLILVETNWPQRQGIVPPTAGGPRESPDFYGFRSVLARNWPEAGLALAKLDRGLGLWPAGQAVCPDRAPVSTLDAVAFIAASHMPTRADAPLPLHLPTHSDQLAQVSPAIARGAVRRLAFVADVPNWAYANIIAHISPHLAGRYEVTRFHLVDYPDPVDLLSALFMEGDFDNIHFMWREFCFNMLRRPGMLHALASRHDLGAEQLARLIAAPVLTTTIYDHLFLEPAAIEERRGALALMDGYATASPRLARIYHDRFGRKPDAVTPDGVNTRFFAPAPDQTAITPPASEILRIGWVGNSAWGSGQEGMGDDPKGLHTILKPAIARLQDEGRHIRLVLADRNLQNRDRDQMRSYYATEIDLLVCASAFEGTPNPLLEAMASGRAWVSTDVGIVREVAGPLQSRLILPERSPEAMTAMLRHVMDMPGLIARAGAENLAAAPGLDWAGRVSGWTRLFAAAEAGHSRLTAMTRQEVITARLQTIMATTSPELHATTGPMEGMSRPALEAWLSSALTEIDNRDQWIAEMQDRIKALEAWTETMQTRIRDLESPYHQSLVLRLLGRLRNGIRPDRPVPQPPETEDRP